ALVVTSYNLHWMVGRAPAGHSVPYTTLFRSPTGILQIDTIAPTVPSVAASGSGIDGAGNGDLNAGHVVTLTVTMSEVVTVAGGVPTLSLNNCGGATYNGRSLTNAVSLRFTGGACEDTSDLARTAVTPTLPPASPPAR